MGRANQKRDRLGQFADEGKGEATDEALIARSQKRIIRWKAMQTVARLKADDEVRLLQGKIDFEQARINSLL